MNTSTINHTNVTSQNISHHHSEISFPVELKTFYYCAFSFMFVLGNVGNTLVIYFIGYKNRHRRTNFDVYIISLAVADLLASIFLPTIMIHDLYTLWNHWHLAGIVGCKLFLPMPHINSLVSALMLVVISFDRMRIIRQTKLSQRSRNISTIQVFVVWSIAIIIVSPYIAVLRVENGSCQDHWKPIYRFCYYAVLQCFSCFLPIIVMIATYATSAYTLLRLKIPGDCGNLMGEKRRKQNQKVTQMFGMIVVIFFVMTTPYMISFFIIAYYGTFKKQQYHDNIQLLFHLQYASYTLMGYNSTINPLIYAVRYKGVSKSVRKIFSTSRAKQRKNGITKIKERRYAVTKGPGTEIINEKSTAVVWLLNEDCKKAKV